MSQSCADLIERTLATRKAPGYPGGVGWAEVAEKLADLPAQCRDALLGHVDRLLSDGFADEGELAVALFGACRGEASERLRGLLVRAAQSTRTVFKEDYAGLLDDLFGEDVGSRALAEVVEAAARGEQRPDTAPSLQALLSARSPVAVVPARRLLASGDSTVRDAASSYLYNLDDDGSAPYFLARLEDETDPHAVTVLTDGLVRWDRREAAGRLRELAADERRPDDVRDVLARAAGDLELG